MESKRLMGDKISDAVITRNNDRDKNNLVDKNKSFLTDRMGINRSRVKGNMTKWGDAKISA
jgi:hypothetical protein